MKTITINGAEYNVYGHNEITDYPQPHISIASSGEIPSGKQRGLLISYLMENGITPPNSLVGVTPGCYAGTFFV